MQFSVLKSSVKHLQQKYFQEMTKTLRANHAPYMTKRLKKAIMKRLELKSKHLKIQTE